MLTFARTLGLLVMSGQIFLPNMPPFALSPLHLGWAGSLCTKEASWSRGNHTTTSTNIKSQNTHPALHPRSLEQTPSFVNCKTVKKQKPYNLAELVYISLFYAVSETSTELTVSPDTYLPVHLGLHRMDML